MTIVDSCRWQIVSWKRALRIQKIEDKNRIQKTECRIQEKK